MKQFLKFTTQLLMVMGVILVFTHIQALAANSTLPISEEAEIIYGSGDIPVPPDKEGKQIAFDLILGGLNYVKIIVAVIAILYISILGLQLVMARGNEEDINSAKRGLVFAIIALGMVSMSQDLAKIFDMRKTTLLESPQTILERVHLFDRRVEVLITFIKNIIGAFATLMVVRSAASLITAGGNEEKTSQHKKGILYSGGGLILIYVGEIFIEKVFYKVDKQVYTGINGVQPGVDVKQGVEEIIGITNFVVAFIAPIAVLMLIIAAIMYATANGEEERIEKAKRIIFVTVASIVIIYGAFALVSTVISSRLTEIGAIEE